MTLDRQRLGRKGEALAEAFLRDKEYRIEARNVRTKHGEIDLVAMDGHTLVFIEVRTRAGTIFGSPEESITWRKQRKLRELALAYLQSSDSRVSLFRFDVVSIRFLPGEITPQINHIEYAF